MTERPKPRPGAELGGSALASDPDGKARIEALLSAGKTRDAVDLAKERFKALRSAEAEALLVEAYAGHVRTLTGRKMYGEAKALAALVSERFPRHRERFTGLTRQGELFSPGDVEPLLVELRAAEGARRRELEAILRRQLTDPALVADSRALGEEEPLRQAAGAVRELFTAVTTGPLSEGALARLDPIPRHSPLAPWKLLIRAIDAYYRRDQAAALANLAAIPADSPPARLAPGLGAVLGGPAAPAAAASPTVDTLLDRLSGSRALVQRHVGRLLQALTAKDAHRAAMAAQDLLADLRPYHAGVRRTAVATVLHQWMSRDLDPDKLLAVLQRKPETDTLRLVALALEREGAWDAALHWWDRYLSAARRTGALPAAGREVGRILLHMAQLFPPDPDEVCEAFAVDSEDELPVLARSGELPAYADRGRLLEEAREADPTPAVFRALVGHWDKREPGRAEGEAEAWHRAFPAEVEPLLYLSRAAEGRGAFRKALDFLSRAEAVNRLHADVRRSRFRLLLASAERRLADGKLALAAADLDRLDAEPAAGEGDTMAYLAALRWVLAQKEAAASPDGQSERRQGDGGLSSAEPPPGLAEPARNPELTALILESVAPSFGLEAPGLGEAASPGQAVEALARACDLFRALDRPLRVDPGRLARAERDLAGAPLAALHSLCGGGLALGRPSLTWVAAGQGLAHDGPHLHRFLLARGRVLAIAGTERDRRRAHRCLCAARELAERARDLEAVREAAAALRTLPVDPFDLGGRRPHAESLSPDEITRVLADERRRPELPHFVDDRKPRKRRRRPRPEPRLFDNLLAFLERVR